mmetsp:Transcript_23036/g.58096  ORF Transcript_23036/g.58096 Transcript_23036/m.58096 type:complete len:320 (+) Transcript_23036:43-1002(+)
MTSSHQRYRELLRLAKLVDREPARRALLKPLCAELAHVDVFSTPASSLLREAFRGSLEGASPQTEVMAAAAMAELKWAMHRPAYYRAKQAKLSIHGPPVPSSNQSWYEARLHGESAGPAKNPFSLMQEAMQARVAPTSAMCSAAARHASERQDLGSLLLVLGVLERNTPHVPDPIMAGQVVTAMVEAQDLERGLCAAEAFIEAGVVPDPGSLTCLTQKYHQMFTVLHPGCLPNAMGAVGQTAAGTGSAFANSLRRLGRVLIPTMATPLANIGALDMYIGMCEQLGELKSAQRARSYVTSHTLFAMEEADGDEIMGMPTD